jgi:hypothetical protein
MGDARFGQAMKMLFDGFVPVQLDVDFRLADHVRLGGYAEYGFASAVCNAHIDCSGKNFRAGVQALFPWGEGTISGWVGAGGGFEYSQYQITQPNVYVPGAPDITSTTDLKGWELNVQGGAAWALSGAVKLGPYLMLTTGKYETGFSAYYGKTMHEWVHVGIRGTFGL